MSVKVNINPILHYFDEGQNVVEVNGSTIGECLKELVAKVPGLKKSLFDERGALHDYLEIYINRVRAHPDDYEGPIKDGDELYVMPVISGG